MYFLMAGRDDPFLSFKAATAAATMTVDIVKLAPFLKKAIKSMVEKKTLVQVKGKGASGSFKLGKVEKPKVKKAKKPKAKKTAKPKKAKSPKKKAAKKSPAKKKPAAKKAKAPAKKAA